MQPKTESLAELASQIQGCIELRNGTGNQDQYTAIVRTVLKLAADNAARGDLKILSRALQELRHAFRIFVAYRSVRKVSVFGSTRVAETDPYYHLARELAAALAQAGLMVITGAGPGIMQAGHQGAGRKNSFGVNIRLPSIQEANPFIRDDAKLMNFHFFFTRKLMFVKEADAVVVFPGGFGTQDELFESITLVQTGKSPVVPIILMDLPHGAYWSRWQEFLREDMMSRGYIDENELNLVKIVTDPAAAVLEITNFYRNFHSYRFVNEHLIMRLKFAPTRALIDRLNCDFADIVSRGAVRQSDPLPEEADEPETLHLSRLQMQFNRADFARLRQMIDVINQAV